MSVVGGATALVGTCVAVTAAAMVYRGAVVGRWRLLRDTAARGRPLGDGTSPAVVRILRGPVRRMARPRSGWWSHAFGRRGLRRALAVAAPALAGIIISGPMAGAVMGIYGAVGAHSLEKAARGRAAAKGRAVAVDAVAALAAELRAGLAPGDVATTIERLCPVSEIRGPDATTVVRRIAAAIRVAESSGAPLADVLDRLDAHVRAAERARTTAAAQAAGARASALLLGTMPVAGAALGVLIGIDSLAILLHTPLGGASLSAAVLLQLGGLAWSGRLSRVEVAL